MAEGLVTQAVLGAAVDGICRAIWQAIKRVVKFQSILGGLRTTINSVTLEINRISQLESYKFLEDEIDNVVLLLQKAEELVNRCTNIARWNYYKKYRYSKMLLELDASLSRLSRDLPPPKLLQFLGQVTKQNEILDRILHQRDPNGVNHNGSRAEINFAVTGLKKIVQSLAIWIHSYFIWLTRISRSRWGYRRITTSFCPKFGNGG